MLRIIIRYGILAGLIAAVPWVWFMLTLPADAKGLGGMGGMLQGYLIIIVALSMVFLGIKQHRDRNGGGAIRFGTAFLVGLGISTVASLLYVAGWEISMAFNKFNFTDFYAKSIVDGARARGADAAGLALATAQANEFTRSYANPFYRMSFTFIEMFPVGILVSLVSAAVLRNPKILPANRQHA